MLQIDVYKRQGQEEDTLVRVHAALSVIDSISIHDAVSIEIFGRCTEEMCIRDRTMSFSTRLLRVERLSSRSPCLTVKWV